jgi:hypothetical protein
MAADAREDDGADGCHGRDELLATERMLPEVRDVAGARRLAGRLLDRVFGGADIRLVDVFGAELERGFFTNERRFLADERGFFTNERGFFANERRFFANERRFFADERRFFADERGFFADERRFFANERRFGAGAEALSSGYPELLLEQRRAVHP